MGLEKSKVKSQKSKVKSQKSKLKGTGNGEEETVQVE